MSRITRLFNPRWGYDGWAVRRKGAEKPITWTFSTTKREAARERAGLLNPRHYELVRVKVRLEAIENH